MENFQLPSLKLTFSPLKIGIPNKGKDRIPTINFQGRTVSFREGKLYVREIPQTNIAGYKVQEKTLHFRYLKLLVNILFQWKTSGYKVALLK